MWILKLRIKHDCTIGNRCKRFKVISYSIPLGNWTEKGFNYTSERHTLEGKEENIKQFIEDIKKDKRVTHLEVDKNTLFFIGKNKDKKIPSSFYNQKMFFPKPVFVDDEGNEFWEVASWDRKVLTNFIENLRKQKDMKIEMLSFKDTKLNDVYFPSVMPPLTEKQKRTFELAVKEGYYDIPKRTDLIKLAKMIKVSVATCQEHLKRAEAKIIPKFKV